MTNPPKKERNAPKLAYTELGIDISFVAAIWHLSRVSHLAGLEIERVCRTHDLSSADINVLGAIWNAETPTLRATDLAEMLRVSNAVLSPRVAKLERKGLLERHPSETDRRATELSLTPEGGRAIEAAFLDIGKTSFVEHLTPRAGPGRSGADPGNAAQRVVAKRQFQNPRRMTGPKDTGWKHPGRCPQSSARSVRSPHPGDHRLDVVCRRDAGGPLNDAIGFLCHEFLIFCFREKSARLCTGLAVLSVRL